MMDVIPSINCGDERCVREKLEVLEKFFEPRAFVHLDVTDRIFSAHETWGNARGWGTFRSPFSLEVHLMVESPVEHAEDWFAAGARRLIVHSEMLTNEALHVLFQIANRYRGELVLGSNPQTTSDEIAPFVSRFAKFHVLSVNPGASGQAFLPFTEEKIKFLREVSPDATIEVDGGINPETARIAKSAGADTLVSAKYIFESSDPQAAFKTLQAI